MTIPSVHEWCRECRDTLPYGAPGVPADFILWGKLFPPEAFGPKCHDHAAKYVDMASLDQWAVYDLRPARALAAQIEAVETRRSRPWRRADRGRGDVGTARPVRSPRPPRRAGWCGVTAPDQPPTAGGLDMRLREHLWAYGAVLNGVGYEPVGAQEYPGINDARDVVLRDPDGVLWDVNIRVTISPRPTA